MSCYCFDSNTYHTLFCLPIHGWQIRFYGKYTVWYIPQHLLPRSLTSREGSFANIFYVHPYLNTRSNLTLAYYSNGWQTTTNQVTRCGIFPSICRLSFPAMTAWRIQALLPGLAKPNAAARIPSRNGSSVVGRVGGKGTNLRGKFHLNQPSIFKKKIC